MTDDDIRAIFEAELAPIGATIEQQPAPRLVRWLGRAVKDGQAWGLLVMPHYDADFVRLQARNAATAFNRGFAQPVA